MTNQQLWNIALKQSAIDLGCTIQDLTSDQNVVVLSRPHPQARKYLQLPFSCNLVSYGSNIVASVSPQFCDIVTKYISRYPVAHCFETPNLHILSQALAPFGQQICFMAEYFLPDMEKLQPLCCNYELRLLNPKDFAELYLPQWSNALCEKRRHLDRLAVGAYHQNQLIGLAGCSADCDDMWQIGIDVLPAFRRQGVASALTSRLALEILQREKVPFYCAAWSNLPSIRNALRSFFRPAWIEMTAKPTAFVHQMNGLSENPTEHL